MLVRALCLRHLGVKLTPEELKAEVPMVGTLLYADSYYGGRDGRGARKCLLMPLSGSTEPHVQLHKAKILRVEKRGLVIAGEEDVYVRKDRSTYPQALWAWPISPDDIRRVLPDPLDVEDENEALAAALR